MVSNSNNSNSNVDWHGAFDPMGLSFADQRSGDGEDQAMIESSAEGSV